jgi:NADPH:quinone reductase-like Zn-dependent oxidoreductase
MRAIEVDGAGRLSLTDVEEPRPADDQLLVRVQATSVNRGEVLRARAAGAGFRPGWDFAGVVEQSVAGGLAEGTRVAGYLRSSAWAERIAVPSSQVAALPDEVSLETAACLPVAGLTALGAIDAGGSLLGRRVLVTGASGGVGAFAVNLAMAAGAEVVAVVRRPAEDCARLFVGSPEILSIPSGLAGAERRGPYDLIVETLGGPALADALTLLSPTGKCMTLGVTDAPAVTFDAERFFMTGNASLEGYVLFRDRGAPPAERLERLLRLAARGALPVAIGLAERWENAEAVVGQLLSRSFLGKAVIYVGP